MKIFITGGTGFFGKSMLSYKLLNGSWSHSNDEWHILSRDPRAFCSRCPSLSNQSNVHFIEGNVLDKNSFPKDAQFDAIIHAASYVQGVASDNDTYKVIIDGTENIIDFAYAAGCSRILFTSSGAVYGKSSIPCKENFECHPTTAYGKAKYEAEKMLVGSGLDVKIARCFALVGQYLQQDMHYAIGNFMSCCKLSKDIIIRGNGKSTRSYLYADDLVEWLFKILDYGQKNQPYNVGSENPISIYDLANLCKDVLKSKSKVVVKNEDLHESFYVPDTSLARLTLSLEEKTPLPIAIMKSINEMIK